MAAAGQEVEARRCLVERLAFRQDPPADADHRVRGEREARREIGRLRRHRRRSERLLHGQSFGERARRFAATRRLIDLGRQDRVRLDADLGQKREPTRGSRRKHEARARLRGGRGHGRAAH